MDPAQLEQTSIAQESTAAGERSDHKRDALYYAILISVAIIPYLNTLGAGFVYDDNYQIVGNPYLRSFRYLRQILFTPVWSFKYAHVHTNYYRPLMPLQYLVMYKMYGPLAYVFHLANVVMHAAVVILLFAVTRKLFGSARLAFVAAALFALHPIHTEVVAWVASVPDLHLALFLLAALWFYLDLGDPQRQRWWTFPAMCAAFFLALFSKEPAIAFPGIMMLYEIFLRPDRNKFTWKQKLWRYAPLWLLTGVYLGARIALMGGLVPKIQHPRLSWYSTILSAVSLFGQYMNKLVWPVRLLMFYPASFTNSLPDPAFLGGAAWVLGLCLLCAVLWKRHRQHILGILWMVAILAPALNSRWMPGNVFAERYLYVPSIGFCWLVGYGGVALWDTSTFRRHAWIRATAISAAVIICVLLAVRTETRNRVWHTDLTLFLDSVEKNPNSSDLHSDLGFAYWALHNHPAALEQWNISLALNPNSFWALNNLGMAALNDKRYDDAIPLLKRAVALSPQFTDAHLNLAETYLEIGQKDAAEKEFHLAIECSPLDWDVHNRYADFLLEAGRTEDARNQFQISLDVQLNAQALDGLGDIALGRQQTDLAERYFRQAADLDSYDHHAHYQLVLIYAASGRVNQANEEYKLGQQTDVGTDKLSQAAKTAIGSAQKK